MTNAGDVSFGRETLKGVGAKLAMYVFGFLATAYFARELGPEAFGGFYLLLSVVQFANRVPHGIGGACQKRLAEADTPDGEILGITLGLALAGGVVATVAAAVGGDHLAAYTGIPNAATLAVPLFVAVSLFLPLQFLLAGTGRFGVTNWIDFLREVLKTVAQVALVLLGFGVTGMVVGFVGATVLCIPIVLYCLGIRPALTGRDTVAYVWDYAKFNVPSNVVGKAYTRFDVFLLGAVGLTSAVGYYEVALSITALATLISGVVMDGVISRVSNLASRGRPIAPTLEATTSYTSVIAIPMFVLVALLNDPLVRTLYGTDYLATVPFLVGVSVYRVVQTQREPLDSAVKGMGRPDSVFRISVITLATNFLLGAAFVFTVGPVGVVVATVAAELLRCGLLHLALRREGVAIPVLPAPLRAQFLAAGAMAAALGTAVHVLPNTAAYQLGVAGTVGCGIYTAAYLVRDDTARRAVLSLAEPVKRKGRSVFAGIQTPGHE